jgi:hypothetical protein
MSEGTLARCAGSTSAATSVVSTHSPRSVEERRVFIGAREHDGAATHPRRPGTSTPSRSRFASAPQFASSRQSRLAIVASISTHSTPKKREQRGLATPQHGTWAPMPASCALRSGRKRSRRTDAESSSTSNHEQQRSPARSAASRGVGRSRDSPFWCGVCGVRPWRAHLRGYLRRSACFSCKPRHPHREH